MSTSNASPSRRRWLFAFYLVLPVVFVSLVWLGWRFTNHPSLGDSLRVSGQPCSKGDSACALFLGTSSFLIKLPSAVVAIDGFVSRPPLLEVMFGRMQPNQRLVDEVAQQAFKALNAAPRLDAVFVAHAHYDHSLDAPIWTKLYGGQYAGSSSAIQVAQGQGLELSRMAALGNDSIMQWGEWRVRSVFSKHAPTGFTGGVISEPLKLPAHALAFKEGQSYTFLLEQKVRDQWTTRTLIQPSGGYVPGQNKDTRTDVVLLGIGGLGKTSAEYRKAYWQEMVMQTNAKRVYLIHWDDFTRPLLNGISQSKLAPAPEAIDDLHQSLAHFNELAEKSGVRVSLLDAWDHLEIQ